MIFENIKNKVAGTMKSGGYRLGERPSLDWLFVLAGFFILTAILLLVTIAYRPSASTVPALEGNAPELLPEKQLNRVITYYEEKRVQFESLLNSPDSLPDPSR